MSDQHSRLPESLKPTFVLGSRAVLNDKAGRTYDPVFFCKAAGNFSRDSWLMHSGLVPQAQPSGSRARLWAQTLPVGRLWYRRDPRRWSGSSG